MESFSGPSSPEVLVAIDRDAPRPLHVQIEQDLRAQIRSGRLATGARLPSTRLLAQDLGVARGVVSEAYAQLSAEGWLVGRRGAGTVVAEQVDGPRSELEHRARRELVPVRVDFGFGTPDLSVFPRRRWLAATRTALAQLTDRELGYGDPRGLVQLREELSSYLGRARAVVADAEHTLVCNGTVQGLALTCHALRRLGARRVAVEDPGWSAQRVAVERAGLTAVPVPVDADGLQVERLAGLRIDAAILTPAHQFPTGAVLAPQRRKQLLAWATEHDAYVIEDAYDAEYRYDRNPTGSLQALAPERVVYAGSASKTLAPALRLGWLVLPPALADLVPSEKQAEDRGSSPLIQLAFAHFLAAGDFDRNLRRMRLRYRRRRDALIEALATHLPQLELTGAAAGLHALALLPQSAPEERIVAAARARGVVLSGLGELRIVARESQPGLVLGYAAVTEEAIEDGIVELAAAIRECDPAGF